MDVNYDLVDRDIARSTIVEPDRACVIAEGVRATDSLAGNGSAKEDGVQCPRPGKGKRCPVRHKAASLYHHVPPYVLLLHKFPLSPQFIQYYHCHSKNIKERSFLAFSPIGNQHVAVRATTRVAPTSQADGDTTCRGEPGGRPAKALASIRPPMQFIFIYAGQSR